MCYGTRIPAGIATQLLGDPQANIFFLSKPKILTLLCFAYREV